MIHILSNATGFGGAEIFIVDLVKLLRPSTIWARESILKRIRSKNNFDQSNLFFQNIDPHYESAIDEFLLQFNNPEDILFINVQWPGTYREIFSKLHLVKSKIHLHIHLFPYGIFPDIAAENFTISCVSKDIADRIKLKKNLNSVVTGNQPTSGIDSYLKVPILERLRKKALVIGRVDSQKNFDEALFLTKILKNESLIDGVDWAGWNDFESYFLKSSINFLGSQNIETILRNYDIVIFFSKYEGLSLSLMESLAAGKLVIAPNVSSFPEVIENGYNGLLYEEDNIADFLGCFSFLESSEKIYRIRQQARLSVVEYCEKYKVFDIIQRSMGCYAK